MRNSGGGQEVKNLLYILSALEMEDSEYIKRLDEPVRSRICQKIETHVGCDPYKNDEKRLFPQLD